MTTAIETQLAARLREESEATREDEYPEGTRPPHPNLTLLLEGVRPSGPPHQGTHSRSTDPSTA